MMHWFDIDFALACVDRLNPAFFACTVHTYTSSSDERTHGGTMVNERLSQSRGCQAQTLGVPFPLRCNKVNAPSTVFLVIPCWITVAYARVSRPRSHNNRARLRPTVRRNKGRGLIPSKRCCRFKHEASKLQAIWRFVIESRLPGHTKPLCLALSLTPPVTARIGYHVMAPGRRCKEAQARPSRMGFTLDCCGSRCTISISHTSGTFSQSSTPETPWTSIFYFAILEDLQTSEVLFSPLSIPHGSEKLGNLPGAT